MEHKHPLSFSILSTLAVILFLVNCSNYGLPEPNDLVLSNWGKSTVDTAPDESVFNATALDNQDNVYAVGYQKTTGTYGYGDGITVSGANADTNALIIKYSPDDGTTQWAKSTTIAPDASKFKAVATDNKGNIYAVGFQKTTGTYDYGDGLTVSGGKSNGMNAVIVKYDNKGKVQWAKSTYPTSPISIFTSVTTDKSGFIYAVGTQGNGTGNYGDEITVASTIISVLIVKYSPQGKTLWAKGVQGQQEAQFTGITTDNDGNIYAVGHQTGSGTYDYGGATVNSANTNTNILIVKYNSNGIAQWARSTVTASNNSTFQGVTTDRYGNVYAVGYQVGTNAFYYGGLSKAITGSSNSTTTGTSPNNALLVKYNSDGQAQWAKTTTRGVNGSEFQAVATTFAGDIYAVGKQNTDDMYSYGNGVTAKGVSGNFSATVVAYNSLGTTQWAKTTIDGDSKSVFNGIVANSNKLFVVGCQNSDGDGIYNYNNGVDLKAVGDSPPSYKAIATTFRH